MELQDSPSDFPKFLEKRQSIPVPYFGYAFRGSKFNYLCPVRVRNHALYLGHSEIAFLCKSLYFPARTRSLIRGGKTPLSSSIYDLQQRVIELERRINTLQSQVERLLSWRDPSLSTRGQARKFVQQLPLTPAEQKVVIEFLSMLSDKKTAARLGRSVQTVRNQINSAQKKLGLRSRQELISAMLNCGATKFHS